MPLNSLEGNFVDPGIACVFQEHFGAEAMLWIGVSTTGHPSSTVALSGEPIFEPGVRMVHHIVC